MNIPKLRFPDFKKSWVNEKMGVVYSFKVTNSFSRENLNYEKGNVKNIHYGDIHKKFQTLFDITKEDVPFINSNLSIERIIEDNYCQEGDLILADASEDINDVGKSIELVFLNKERILSGLHTILARPDLEKLSIGFAGYLFTSNTVRTQIQKESQGTKVLSISATRLSNISLIIPSDKKEQQKIANLLKAVDVKLQALKKKKDLLEEYKKGAIQKLFSQEIRFKDENGTLFPDWKDRKLGDVLHEHKLKSTGNEEVFSVSVHKGLINQIEHLGRSFSASNTDHYNLVQPNDIVYTKSPTGDFPLGIIKQSKIDKNVIVSPLYGIFTPESKGLGYLLNVHFESPINTANYLGSLIQKGAKNTINITNSTFLSKEMKLPTSIEEQNKIGDFLEAIDKKITELGAQIDNVGTWKKGLLQKMFC